MSHWIDDLADVQSRQQPAISVAVASTKGSVPREAGTRMLVTPAEVLGTIGGGHLEFKAIQIARDMLAAGGKGALMRFPLGASLGQCCGGLMNLLFEPVLPCDDWVTAVRDFRHKGKSIIALTRARGCGASGKLFVATDELVGSLGAETLDREITAIARQRLADNSTSTLLTVAGDEYFFEAIAAPDFNIVLFGAGHVGRAVVKILAELPCRITWIDCREAEFPVKIPPGIDARVNDTPEDEVKLAPAGSYFLVMTHSHQLDQEICERIFAREDFAYFGLIGSLSKRRQFERRLAARGIPAARFADMRCPIGSASLSSKEPMAIAISVAAELLQRREALQQMRKVGISDFRSRPRVVNGRLDPV
jgi:xanthine dehydrogenase accessory factor